MKANRKLALATLTAMAIFGAATSSATATDVTVDLVVSANSAGLTLSSAASSATDLAVTYSASAQTAGGAMPALTVTDTSGDLVSGWTLNVSGTSFTNSGPANTDAVVYFGVADLAALVTASTLSTSMSLTGCHCAATGAAALDNGVTGEDLATEYTLASGLATSLLTDPTVTFTPSIHVAIPAKLAAGTYQTTVTYDLT